MSQPSGIPYPHLRLTRHRTVISYTLCPKEAISSRLALARSIPRIFEGFLCELDRAVSYLPRQSPRRTGAFSYPSPRGEDDGRKQEASFFQRLNKIAAAHGDDWYTAHGHGD